MAPAWHLDSFIGSFLVSFNKKKHLQSSGLNPAKLPKPLGRPLVLSAGTWSTTPAIERLQLATSQFS